MKKISMILVLVGTCGLIFFAQNKTNSKNVCSSNENIPEQCSCSPTVDGLQYCADVQVIKDESKTTIRLRDSLTNVGDKPIEIGMNGNYYVVYDVKIIAPSGKKLLSKREIEQEEEMNKPENERKVDVPLGVYHGDLTKDLTPKESLSGGQDLGMFYSFEEKGVYQVEIIRKVRTIGDKRLKDLPSGIITVNVE